MINPVHEAVARQYEKWVYPKPIEDLSAPELKNCWDGGDPSKRYYVYWPHRAFRNDMNILVAGCGSNAAARYAYHHPQSKVTGIDISTSSLAHEAYLQEKHKLGNLSLHHCAIEDIATLGETFDFIDTSGVLHHLPDPVAGLQALGSVLDADGVIAVMLYGKYGRAGVYMMQELFGLMGLEQTERDLNTVKETLAAIPKGHTIHRYLSISRDTKYDAGLVDTFLHPQDRAYTTQECVQFAKDSGMSFMGWWDNILYYTEGQLNAESPLARRLNALPEEDIWAAMEVYNGTLGQHAFCVCHPSRSAATYKPNFDSPELLSYVPVRNCETHFDDGQLLRLKRERFPVIELQPGVASLFRQIDGIKTVGECFDAARAARPSDADKRATCRDAFRYLWRLSYVYLRMPRGR